MDDNRLDLTTMEPEPDIGVPTSAAERVIEETPAPPSTPFESPEEPTPPKAEKAEEPEEDPIEAIQPSSEPVKRSLMDDQGNVADYYQAPLLFFSKIEFFSLVGDTLSKAMEGEGGLTVMALMDTAPRAIDSQALASADTFIAGIAKLTSHVPNFLKDCYCIWLDIPMRERAWAREAMKNMNDAEGISIIETFLDQNSAAMEDFFRNEGSRLLEKIQASFTRTDS